jgi:hypothetical protein
LRFEISELRAVEEVGGTVAFSCRALGGADKQGGAVAARGENFRFEISQFRFEILGRDAGFWGVGIVVRVGRSGEFQI